MKVKVLFITTINLAANPRLLKELRLIIEKGYEATVILFKLGNWSDELDDELRSSLRNVRFIRISALRLPFLPWVLSSALEKIFRFLPVGGLNTSMLSMAVSKRSYLLLQRVKQLNESFDWVIAHNPAAFYPAYEAAKKTGASLGIDVEDYHPGETNDLKAKNRLKRLMQQVLPFADYCSYAAPLILEEVKKDIPGLENKQLVILNGFNKEEFSVPVDSGKDALQLIWFSQNIDANRGLENLIPAVNDLYPEVELHLIGNIKPAFEKMYLQNKKGIVLHGSKPQKELHQFLATCDVGLALEPGKDMNNTLAISNKLIAYVQAGLFIAATHTLAQDEFLAKSRLDFEQVEDQTSSFKSLLQRLCYKKTELRKKKAERFVTGREYDWQQIAKPLLNVWVKK